ncbi:hypothetical protein BS78_08G163100 [Paspalum vaginatum]|nr:hypothetical protein BS78_08G163100 [Paspalum vaginatum]
MASTSILVVLLAAFAAGASAATKNNCSYTVWPAVTPVGGGKQLGPGQTWTLDVPTGTQSGRIWGRTGCFFNGAGHGHCATGDCAGALSCTRSRSLSQQPHVTLAEFTIVGSGLSGILAGGANDDKYGISLVNGYNLPMDFSCSTGGLNLHCGGPSCPDAKKTHGCRGNSNYKVTFCQ